MLITGSSGDRRKLIRAIFLSGRERERERGDPEHGVNVVMDKGLEIWCKLYRKLEYRMFERYERIFDC